MKLLRLRALQLFALGGLALVASGSCGAVLPLGSVASGSRVSPPPTPVASTPPNGNTSYSNTLDHYSVAYPTGWYIIPATAPGDAVSISNEPFDAMHPNRWKVDIVISANPRGLTASQWADNDKRNHSQTVIKEAPVIVGGEMGVERYISQDGSTAFGLWAAHGGHMLLMDATDQPDFQPVFDSIVASFVFTA